MANSDAGHKPFPAAIINITNKCTLKCKHCFVYREGNPADRHDEMDTPTMLAKIDELRRRHDIRVMLWMGGEPLLRPDVLREGTRHFERNHVTTNGTLDLIDLPRCIYIVSVDGPPYINDAVRGKRSFEKVMKTLSRVPADFEPTVMAQCVVTRKNQDRLEELVELLLPTRFEGLNFSFYVPCARDESDLTWGSLDRRDAAVREVIRLKSQYPDFVWANRRGLDLMLSENAKAVTDNCPSRELILPLYLQGEDFVVPYCCYGNDVDCDLCGAWVVFYLAAKMEQGAQQTVPGHGPE
jgi:MoaA/NifB/PqqE/SkfB family radical SAM enzyme